MMSPRWRPGRNSSSTWRTSTSSWPGLPPKLPEHPVPLHGGHPVREKPLQYQRSGRLPLHVLEVGSCPRRQKRLYEHSCCGLMDFLAQHAHHQHRTSPEEAVQGGEQPTAIMAAAGRAFLTKGGTNTAPAPPTSAIPESSASAVAWGRRRWPPLLLSSALTAGDIPRTVVNHEDLGEFPHVSVFRIQ
jgi:hypothetical protein